MHELAKADLKVERRVMPRDEAVATFKKHRRALQGRDHREHPGERGHQPLRPGRLVRPVPRPARAEHRQARRLQADEGRGRLLARRFEATRCSSASTARPGRTRRASRPISPGSRKPRSAITAASAANSDLFHTQEEAVGSVFWHPKGWTLWRTIEHYMRERLAQAGYVEVQHAAADRPRAVGAVRPLGELRAEHVHRRVRGAHARGQADELPGPRA